MGDEVWAACVPLDLGDEGRADDRGVGVAPDVGDLLAVRDAEADGDGQV